MINYDELCEFAKSKIGTPYVYGAKGTVMTRGQIQSLQNQYGKGCVWDSDLNKAGQVCVDCSGLISWATGIQRGSLQYKNTAIEVIPISQRTNDMYGYAVWMNGHIGIYLGNDTYIAADGSNYGVRIANLSQNKFTHLLKLCDVDYTRSTQSESTIDYETIAKLQEIQKLEQQAKLNAEAEEKKKAEQYQAILEAKRLSLCYRTHVQNEGWQEPVYSGTVSGTTGKNLQLEAIKIDAKFSVKAKAHIGNIGWKDYGLINRDTIIGTVGESKAIECLCFEGNFKYRVHIQNVGWSGWTNADGISTLGTVGQALHIEAIQMQVL